MYLRFVFLVFLFGCDAREIQVNDLADPVFEEFRKVSFDIGKEATPVSDMVEEYRVKVPFVNYRFALFRFECKNGLVRDISTVRRVGDVYLHSDKHYVSLDVPFGFETLQYSCDSYLLRVGFPFIKFSGALTAKVGNNQVNMKIGIAYIDEKCTFEVQRLSVTKLDDIKVSVTGFSIFNGIVDKLMSRIAKAFRDTLQNQVANEIRMALKNTAEESELCYENRTSYHH